jgi:hypothetical protein
MSNFGAPRCARALFHSGRAETSRRTALGPGRAEACLRTECPSQSATSPALLAGSSAAQRPNEPDIARARANPSRTPIRTNLSRIRTRTNPSPGKVTPIRASESDRTQAGSKVAATRVPRNPNDPEAGRSLDEVAPSMRDPCRSGGSLCPDCTLRSGASTRYQRRGAWAT